MGIEIESILSCSTAFASRLQNEAENWHFLVHRVTATLLPLLHLEEPLKILGLISPYLITLMVKKNIIIIATNTFLISILNLASLNLRPLPLVLSYVIRSPCSCLFSRLNKPNYLSLSSQERFLKTAVIFPFFQSLEI